MKPLVLMEWFTLALALILSKFIVVADYKVYEPPIKLAPTNELVRYTEGFLNAPDDTNTRDIAIIDLRQLEFTPFLETDRNRELITNQITGGYLRSMGAEEPANFKPHDADNVENAVENAKEYADTKSPSFMPITVSESIQSSDDNNTEPLADAKMLGTKAANLTLAPTSNRTFEPSSIEIPRDSLEPTSDSSDTNSEFEYATSTEEDTHASTITNGNTAQNSALNSGLKNTVIDIAVFTEPLECTNSRQGCDWTELGIGRKWFDEDTITNFYCCTDRAINLNFCDSSNYGQLVLDTTKFKGKTVSLRFDYMEKRKIGNFELATFPLTESGNQVVIMANCNPEGLDVMVSGEARWKSVNGYLPADVYGSLPFFVGVTFLYFLLMMFYGVAVYKNREDGIEIQRWLIGTIAIGFLEVLFRSGDLFVWNATGYRESLFMYSGVFMGVLKRSISRSVIIMLCLGWGIVRVDLGSDMNMIIIFFIIYATVSVISDALFTIALTSAKLSGTDEHNLLSIVEWIAVGVTGLNMVCYCWILDGLSNTIVYLKSNNQDVKLKVYEKLRCCLYLSAVFAVMWTLIGLADVYVDSRLFGKEEEYLITCMWQMNYFFILLFVARLFWPDKNAKRYAYVMELPSDENGAEDHDLDFSLGEDGDDDNCDDGEFHKFNNAFDPNCSDDDDDMGFEMGSRQNGLTLS